MEVLKKGSKGEEVKKLQTILKGIGLYTGVVDGDFGPKTEGAVREYQKTHGLVIDGIVGNKTWEKLLGSDTPDIDIMKGYINTHITRLPGRSIRYIAIHYTAGGSSKKGCALATRNVFLKREASADFVVDDGQIVQINPDLKNYYCWSVGDKKNVYTGGGRLYGIATNRNTVSIEVCSNLKAGASASYPNHDGWYFTKESLANAVKLVKWLMKKYNVPKENVVRHYDVSGKMCPGIIGWNDAWIYSQSGKQMQEKNNSKSWEEFKKSI